MVKILLILLYVYSSDGITQEVKLEQSPHASAEACNEAGRKRIQEIEKDPKYIGGLFAGCLSAAVQQADSSK
jgi:hypothetical protein